MKFARIVFWTAGIWGVLILTPLYFIYDFVGRQDPPPLNHPQFYYGFIGAALAWQLVFMVIGSDPLRFRPMMVPAMFEKFGYVLTVSVLVSMGKLAPQQLMIPAPDAALGILFAMSFVKTREAKS